MYVQYQQLHTVFSNRIDGEKAGAEAAILIPQHLPRFRYAAAL